jgi:hypothetical protein
MMSPQDVLQAGQRTIAPRTGITPRIEGGRNTRDERRRATHNEGMSPNCMSRRATHNEGMSTKRL